MKLIHQVISKKFSLVVLMITLISHDAISQTEVYTADNGITASGTGTARKVSLGGTLTGNTTIPFNNFNLNFSGTGRIGIRTTTPSAPLHVYKNAFDWLPTVVVEDAQNDGYTMLQLYGTGRRYHLGVGNAGETTFGLSNKFFIWDNDAGAARLVVNNTGNVGIGNNDPNNRLTITAATAGATGLRFTQINSGTAAVAGNGKVLSLDGTGNVVLVTDGGAGGGWGLTGNVGTTPATNFIGTTDNQRLAFRANNTEYATILTNGNVLLGSTTDNGNKLQVNGDVSLTSAQPHIRSPRYPILAGDESGGSFLFYGDNTARTINIGTAHGNNFHKFKFQNAGQTGDDVAAYNFVYNSLTSPALNIFNFNQGHTKMQVSADGNLILASAPTVTDNGNKLQVNGKTWTTELMIPTGAGLGKVLTSDGSGNATWQTAAGGSTDVWIYGGNNVSAVSKIGNTSAQNLQIITNNEARIHIDDDGNVGIGTVNVNDAAYKLFVEGSIRTRKVRVDALVWPDYVFHPTYKLRPLSEVEQFISNNSHLPDVPSASEVAKEGVDLGDNQAVLLRKIEELTLYIIEQNKKLEEHSKKIQQLEQELKRRK